MLRKLTISFFAILISIHGQAQVSIGFGVGTVYNRLTAIDQDNNYDMSGNWGTNFYLVAGKNLNPDWELRGTLGFIKKGYTKRRKGEQAAIFQNFTNSYISTSATIHYARSISRLTVGVFGGLSAGYRIAAIETGAIPDAFSATPVIIDGQIQETIKLYRYKRKTKPHDGVRDWEWGGISGLDFKYALKFPITIFADFEYNRSFSALRSGNDMAGYIGYNSAITGSLGLLYRLR